MKRNKCNAPSSSWCNARRRNASCRQHSPCCATSAGWSPVRIRNRRRCAAFAWRCSTSTNLFMSIKPHPQCTGSRRQFLWEMGAGFSGLALASLLDGDGFFTRPAVAAELATTNPLAPRVVHFPVKAKACIFLFMFGGPSQVDLFDYKPELQKRDGQSIDNEFRRNTKTKAVLQASRRTFTQHGQSGLWCSDAFPNISRHMDKLAVVKSLYSDSFAHGSAVLQMNTGRILQGHPSVGAWLSYGLGTMNQNLPGYVVMLDPRGGPTTGAPNWSGGYMPAVHQGTVLRTAGDPILNLQPPAGTSRERQRREIDFINALNAGHQQVRPGYSELAARIASYELAFRLQTTAPEALDLSSED